MYRRFTSTEQKFPAIKRKYLIINILLGVLYAFIFYAFLCLVREVVRLYTITEQYDIWILSDREVHFYNLFFAYLALIFAQSACLSRWFGGIRRPFEKVNLRKPSILNNQQFLNFVFLHWFSQLALIYALFMGIHANGFYVFSFYPKYNFMFIFMLIVLFSNTWIGILRMYKRKVLKWMLYSAILISVFAFAFSRINFIDYQKINEMVLDKNIAKKYNLELAEATTFDWDLQFYNINDIYLLKPSDTATSKTPLIIFHKGYGFENEKLSFDDLEQSITLFINQYYREPSFCTFRLFIDKSIEMQYVNRLHEALQNVEIYKVAYAVIPQEREYDERYYTDYYLSWRLPYKQPFPPLFHFFEKILFVHYFNDSLQINDSTYSTKDFYSKIRQEIEKYDDYFIVFSVDDAMVFADYLFVKSEIKRAYNAIRNEYALRNYSAEYERLKREDREKMKIIQQKIPIKLIEKTKN